MIGRSGLITPSLDEMVTVGEEMSRAGMTMPFFFFVYIPVHTYSTTLVSTATALFLIEWLELAGLPSFRAR